MKAIPLLALFYLSPALLAHGATPSPYIGQEARAIKALSAAEQDDLLAGRGMGLAKVAELNGYPGPLHVLDLAAQLELTEDQRGSTRKLYEAMQLRAQDLGRRIIEAEKALDALFASQRIAQPELAKSLARIGSLQAQLRAVHLEAHLEQRRILSPVQIAKYRELRGYSQDAHSTPGHAH